MLRKNKNSKTDSLRRNGAGKGNQIQFHKTGKLVIRVSVCICKATIVDYRVEQASECQEHHMRINSVFSEGLTLPTHLSIFPVEITPFSISPLSCCFHSLLSPSRLYISLNFSMRYHWSWLGPLTAMQ